jgi:hypothetical protein
VADLAVEGVHAYAAAVEVGRVLRGADDVAECGPVAVLGEEVAVNRDVEPGNGAPVDDERQSCP